MIKNKLNKKDYLNITCLSLLYLFIVLIITHGENMYGSVVDWSIQHYSIPEYFRTLFYDTHNLFPQFAPNLGGGQNIFYFAYYGLLSPIILLSYVFLDLFFLIIRTFAFDVNVLMRNRIAVNN